VYVFRHPLTHEVALGGLLSERRRELHRRAAQAITELNPERGGEIAALVAQHYEQAGLVLEGCTWYLSAASWAMANDHTAAMGHLNRVRVLDSELPDGAEADLLRANVSAFFLAVGWRVGADVDRMREVFEESVAAATRARDDRLLAQVQISYIAYLGTTAGRIDESAALATDFLRAARRSGDLDLAAAAQAMASYAYVMAGRYSDALAASEAALELTVDQPDRGIGFAVESPRGLALQWGGQAMAALGRPVEALVALDEAEAFLRGRGCKETLCWTPWHRLVALRAAGPEAGEAEVAFAREALAIAEAISGPFSRMLSQTALAMAYLGVSRFTESIETAERAIAAIETSGTGRGMEALPRSIRALGLTESRDPVGGMAEAEKAIRCCIETGNRWDRAGSCAAFAVAAAAAGTELDRALEVLDDGERVVAETGARGLLPELLYARARAQAARGEREARSQTLRHGLHVTGENQAQGWEKRFQDALADRTEPLGSQRE
jgi:adenylate cyclase